MNIRNFKIKYMFIILSCFLLVGNLGIKEARAEALDSDIVTFPDSNLEAAVREKLTIPTGDITVGDMREMKGSLQAGGRNISNLNGLEHAINISVLRLEENQINNVEPLKNLTNLNELYLYKNQLTDITPLKNLTKLNTLYLWSNLIDDISALNSMVEMETLYLSNNNIIDITPLKSMAMLKTLELGNNQIIDISPLKNIKTLTSIGLRNNYIKDLSSLSNLTIVNILDLIGNDIIDITPLSNMIKLNYLRLNDNKIRDISPLAGSTELKRLYLNNNQISDISALSKMVNLEWLFLNDNQISDISPLNKMVNLEWLELKNNRIADINPLSNIVNIKTLLLCDNQIKDIETLKNMKNMNVFDISNNYIEKVPAFVGNFKYMLFMDFSNNNIVGNLPEELNNLTNLIYDSTSIGEPGYLTSFAGNQIIGTLPSGLKTTLNEPLAFANNLLEGELNQKQLTLKAGAEFNLSLNSQPTQNMLKSLVHLDKGDGTFEDSLYELELVPTDPTFFDASGKTIKSGATTAYIKLKGVSDTNAYAKTAEAVPIAISDKIGSNNDINLNFSIDNSLEVTLGSNTVNFGEVSSLGGEVESTTLTVTSSLPYDISTMAYDDFVGSLDSANIIPIDKISLDIDALGYKALTKNKTLNIGDSPSAINKIHNLNLKMGDTLGYKKDDYNTSIQFIVDTK